MAVILVVFVLALVLNQWIYIQAPRYFPANAEDIEDFAAALTFIGLVLAFFWPLLVDAVRSRQHRSFIVGSIDSLRRTSLLSLAMVIVVALCLVLTALAQIDWKLKVFGLVVIGVVPGVVLQARNVLIELAFRGSYDRALRIQRWIAAVPNCGSILKGWILLEAGRYQEARDVLRAGALDAENKPRVHTFHVVLYAHSFGAEGALDAAIALYEACEHVHPCFENHKLGLASCLLVRGTDAARARELIEGVLANCRFDGEADRACAVGLHAYSLAANGCQEYARQQMAESFAKFDRHRSRDQAGLWLVAGATYLALGEHETARRAFRESIRIHPFGSNKLRAEDWLRRVDEASSAG